MAATDGSEEAKHIYKDRAATAECVNALAREAVGLEILTDALYPTLSNPIAQSITGQLDRQTRILASGFVIRGKLW